MTCLSAVVAYLVGSIAAAFAVGAALRRLGRYPSPTPTDQKETHKP